MCFYLIWYKIDNIKKKIFFCLFPVDFAGNWYIEQNSTEH